MANLITRNLNALATDITSEYANGIVTTVYKNGNVTITIDQKLMPNRDEFRAVVKSNGHTVYNSGNRHYLSTQKLLRVIVETCSYQYDKDENMWCENREVLKWLLSF